MDKGELKAAVVHEIGCKTDDMLEAAKTEMSRHEGAKLALALASKQVAALGNHVDKDMDAGEFSNLDGPLEVAKAIKKYLQRATGVVDSGVASAENHRLIAQGKVQAFELVVGNMQKLKEIELAKSKVHREREAQLAAAVKDGEAEADKPEAEESGKPREPGTAPKVPLKARRQAEAVVPSSKAQKPVKKGKNAPDTGQKTGRK